MSWFEDRFDDWRFPDALKPAVGGLLLGSLAFVYPLVLGQGLVPAQEAHLGLPLLANLPHIFGAGFPVIEGALQGQLSFLLLLVLVFLKPLATSLTLGSGNSGGVFAPALFIGAALGGAFGQGVELLMPGATAGAGAFAVVGMAAVFAGAAHAPFTAILIVFEMTGDYRLILPLMAGVIVSMKVSERLHRDSIYTIKLTRRGIRIRRGRDVDVMEAVRVEEVMTRPPATVPVDLPVPLLASEFVRTGRHGLAVLDEEGKLFGIVSLQDYRDVVDESSLDQCTVRDIATRDVVTVFPDDSVGHALRRMAPRDLSRLPVVARDDPRRLQGIVRRNDIVRAYEVGALRQEEARLRAEQSRVVSDPRAQFVEVVLPTRSAHAGKTVAELGLSHGALLVSIRRGRELLIPHGNTQLQPGDVITALSERDFVSQVREQLSAPQED